MLRKVIFRSFNKRPESDEDTDPSLLQKNVILKKNQNITHDYSIGELLGSGKFGEVKRCTEKGTGGEFAAKFISAAAKEDYDSALNEIAIMNRLRHPRLIQLYDAYSWKSEVILVVELITGGELFERIIDESFDLTESRCIRFMIEILQGVQFIHSQNVLHLDLKPENVLCLSKTSFKTKIIDFGLARFYERQDMCVMFGTPEFVAPEVIAYDPVSPASDMWSLGVICYVMLSGLSPFMGDTPGETMSNILKVNYNFNYPEFAEISEEAMAFIRLLLVKDPRKRLTATECLQHPWIKKRRTPKRKGTVSKKRLKHFVYRRKWQKAVNAIIALLRMGVVLQPDPTYCTGQTPTQIKADTSQKTQTTVRDMSKPAVTSTVKKNKEALLKKNKPVNEPVKTIPKSLSRESKIDTGSNSRANKNRRPSLFAKFSRSVSSESSRRNSKVSISEDSKSESRNSGKKDLLSGLRKKEDTKKIKVKLPTLFTGEVRKGNLNNNDHNESLQSMRTSSERNENADTVEKKIAPSAVRVTPSLTPKKTSLKSKSGTSPSSSTPTSEKTGNTLMRHGHKLDPPKVIKVNNKSLPLTSGIASKIGFFSNLAKDDLPAGKG